MKKNIFTLGVASMAALLALSGEQALAQSSNETTTQVEQQEDDEKKDGFFRRAFRDMKESARLQRQIDKANYEATKLESKAFYQEQKRKSNPKVRTAAERERMEQELKAAEQRREEAQERLDSIRNSK
jgi:hypothetical protein